MRLGTLALSISLALFGCTSATNATSEEGPIETGQCAGYATKLSRSIDEAVETTRTLMSAYSKVVVEEVETKRIRVLPFCSVTASDFHEMVPYVDLSSLEGTESDWYARLRRGDREVMKVMEAGLYGFQWDNRLYLASVMKPEEFVQTLAHEVKHFLRGAAHRNYDDQRVACIEELEAYKAEILVQKDTITDEEIAAIHANMRTLFDFSKLAPDNCGYAK